MKKALVAGLGVALTACTAGPAYDARPRIPPPDKDTCNAAQYAALVGDMISNPGVPLASRQVRHIRPDSIVTMDFSATRLNFNLDAKGRILNISCG